jgi:large subunit ribosomal protein L10
MRRAEKIENVATLSEDLGRATVAVLAEYRGLTSGQLNRLRRAVREANGRCRVTKNTLTRRAVGPSRYKQLEPMLRGPLALILGFKDPIAIAKLAIKFADEMPKLEIKGGVLEGQVLPAQLLGLLQAPAAQLLRTLNEPAARLARLVDAIGKRAGGGAGGETA